MTLSFIIPTRNEESTIKECLSSIVNNMNNFHMNVGYEIIIADNGSTDNTIEIVKQLNLENIKLISVDVGKNVSYVRNKATEYAKGNIFIFIDGDVVLDKTWHSKLDDAINLVSNTSLPTITGAPYGFSDTASWIVQYWHQSRKDKPVTFISAGHMIITKDTFNNLNGFDVNIETGEDVDICNRAKMNKGNVVSIPELKTDHKGYPDTIRGFFNRERWHGKGNWTPLQKIGKTLTSKILVGVFGIGFFSLIFSIMTKNILFLLIIPSVIVILGILMGIKRNGLKTSTFGCIYLSIVLISARCISLIDVLRKTDAYLIRREA